MPEHGLMPMLETTTSWETILDGPVREALEQTVLPQFLRAQRWFGGKARPLESLRLADWAPLEAGACRAFLALFDVRFAGGGTDLYFLPLAITPGPDATRLGQPHQAGVLVPLRGPGGEAVLHDALADDGLCTALLTA